MESNPNLIITNHIILYYTPIIVEIVPFKIVHTQTTLWEVLMAPLDGLENRASCC